MALIKTIINPYIYRITSKRYYVTNISGSEHLKPVKEDNRFETVFKFPFISMISLFNRLKVYQAIGTGISCPACGVLEMLNILPSQSLILAAYIGVTGTALFTLASLPIRNTIGFLYISEDEQQIKISSVDFWGKRQNRIIDTQEWIPILNLPRKTSEVIYLTPQLTDGTKYKLFIKFGISVDPKKMGRVLE